MIAESLTDNQVATKGQGTKRHRSCPVHLSEVRMLVGFRVPRKHGAFNTDCREDGNGPVRRIHEPVAKPDFARNVGANIGIFLFIVLDIVRKRSARTQVRTNRKAALTDSHITEV